MVSTSSYCLIPSSSSCSAQHVSQFQAEYRMEGDEDWEEDFDLDCELNIPTSLVVVQDALNRDRVCMLQLAKRMQELKNLVFKAQTALDPLFSSHSTAPLTRDIQLAKLLLELSENPSHLSELPLMDTHQKLFYCDLDTWNGLENCSALELEEKLSSYSTAPGPELVPDVHWIDLLTLKTEILQSRLEKQLSEAPGVDVETI
ncbi:hypothetical protein K493DRAFT_314231 [Basidiobolus meristosporus CBS 931.73]|uniref:Uncharacterized protein n=1 Tax=Basidiobolus meristosporus CBS 931.73 TaxID=1314790 RepID=A0A1Y1YGE2_9FUNG|nr:hypothetical protein K493DRAFT_314231 [Basidiobolus meristosporus CBS 931.73]|eukprot:ORX97081.1 hypothetical protein K493DRAFT_314231 [Basidiobolus meristosporus CBS 931.73]